MGRSKKMSVLLQTGFTRKSTRSEHVSHGPLFHAAVNPCLQGESPWNWSYNSVNLRKSTVTWMRRHYVFTVNSRWSTFSSTVNLCNINCVIFSDTHCSFGLPILWHSPFYARVSVYWVKSWRWSVKICRYRRLYLCLPFNNLSKLVHKSSLQKAVKIVQCAVYSKKFASCCLPDATCVHRRNMTSASACGQFH